MRTAGGRPALGAAAANLLPLVLTLAPAPPVHKQAELAITMTSNHLVKSSTTFDKDQQASPSSSKQAKHAGSVLWLDAAAAARASWSCKKDLKRALGDNAKAGKLLFPSRDYLIMCILLLDAAAGSGEIWLAQHAHKLEKVDTAVIGILQMVFQHLQYYCALACLHSHECQAAASYTINMVVMSAGSSTCARCVWPKSSYNLPASFCLVCLVERQQCAPHSCYR